MKTIFERRVSLQHLEGKPLADYQPKELCAYILKAFPNDPFGALKCMRENVEVGFVLGEQTRLLLEGVVNVKRN